MKSQTHLFFTSLTVAMLSFVLTACVKPRTKTAAELDAEGGGADAESASYYIGEVTGDASAPDVETFWKFPKAATFSFKTCAKDRRTQDNIRYNKFAIIGGDADQHMRSDGDGCVRWNETIPMNFLATPKYIVLNRTLRSEGLQSGSRKMKIAVYPWDSLKAAPKGAVVDLMLHPDLIESTQIVDGDQATALLQGEDSDGQPQKKYLLMGETQFEVQDLNTSSSGKDFSITLMNPLGVSLTSVDGTPFNYKFLAGKVKVSMALIATTAKDGSETLKNRVVLSKSESKDITVSDENGTFSVSLPVHIAAGTNLGQVEMVVKMTPVEGPDNLEPFEGVFSVGDFRDVTGVGFHRAAPNTKLYNKEGQKFSYDDYTACGPSLLTGKLASSQRKVDPFEFDQLQVRLEFNSSAEKAETGAQRTRLFDVTARIAGFDGTYMRDTNVVVTKTDGSKVPLRTDRLGYIVWNESITHSYYAPETFLDRQVTITFETGFSKTLTLRMDPWQDGSNFGVDARYVDPNDEKQKLANPGSPSRIYILNYQLEQMRTQYEIDKYLQITTHRISRITFQPQVERYSNFLSSIANTETLRNGRYLLKYGIRTEPSGPAYPETVVTKSAIVRVQNGNAQQNIDIPIEDLRLFNVRSVFYVELYGLDETKIGNLSDQDAFKRFTNADDLIDKNSGLQTRTFVGAIQPGVSIATNTLRPVDDLGESFCGHVDCDGLRSVKLGSNSDSAVAGVWPTDMHLAYKSVSELAARQNVLEQGSKQILASMVDPKQFSQALDAVVINLPSESGNKLMRFLNTNESGMLQLINGQVNSNGIIALCNLWAKTVIPQSAPKGKAAFNFLVSSDRFANICSEYYRPKVLQNWIKTISNRQVDMLNPFIIARKVKASEMTYQPQSITNMPLDLAVMNAFTGSYTDSVSYNVNASASLSAGIGPELPGAAHADANVGLGMSRTGSSSQAASTSYTVSAGKTLTVDTISVPITFTKYQRCALINLSPSFFKGNIDLLGLFAGLNNQEKDHILNRKILLCAAEETKPLAVTEKYYVIASPASASSTDQGSLSNMQFAATFRGEADFAKFLNFAQGSLSARDVKKDQTGASGPFVNVMKGYDYLKNTSYLDLSGSYPGLYTMP